MKFQLYVGILSTDLKNSSIKNPDEFTVTDLKSPEKRKIKHVSDSIENLNVVDSTKNSWRDAFYVEEHDKIE